MITRSFTVDDFREVADEILKEECFFKWRISAQKLYDRYCADQMGLAVENGKIVGIFVIWETVSVDFYEMGTWWTRSEFRNNGISQRTLHHAMELLHANKVAFVVTGNSGLIDILLKHDWKEIPGWQRDQMWLPFYRPLDLPSTEKRVPHDGSRLFMKRKSF